MRKYNLLVLGELYPIDQSMLDKSGYLASLFSGRFGQEKTKRFSLRPEDKQAFHYVYDYLLGERPELDPALFPQVLSLASFLDMPDLLSYLQKQIEQGKIPLEVLRSVEPLPQIEIPLAEYFLLHTSKFSLLPPWVQEFFVENQSTSSEPNKDRPLLLFVNKKIKPNKGKKVKFGACLGETRPREIEAASIPQSLRSEKRVYDYRGLFLTCPKSHPRLNLNPNWDVCCAKKGNIDAQLSSLLESYTPVETDLGLVFVSLSYNKDYIFARYYNYIDRLNALIVYG
ncbi:BTB/POZ domain-containing protein [Cedratvirus kamchatka]|uniref:BTB/POZ domain-containing protein n=1 Tax=Cedratvirus kamchatka TaxID=2716914 RepID=A0A6G8MWY1_9VIRU|nr:BTB/POZ domain-containing protein [Cedratvirus kamchatka]